jgi:hypothetical protein
MVVPQSGEPSEVDGEIAGLSAEPWVAADDALLGTVGLQQGGQLAGAGHGLGLALGPQFPGSPAAWGGVEVLSGWSDQDPGAGLLGGLVVRVVVGGEGFVEGLRQGRDAQADVGHPADHLSGGKPDDKVLLSALTGWVVEKPETLRDRRYTEVGRREYSARALAGQLLDRKGRPWRVRAQDAPGTGRAQGVSRKRTLSSA